MSLPYRKHRLLKIIFWEYPRGSWQYDLIVVLILAFVFLTPRNWFRDQPRIARPSDIVMLPAEGNLSVFWLEPQLLSETPESQYIEHVKSLLEKRTGQPQLVLRLEAIYNSENELRGYLAFAKPAKESQHRRSEKPSALEKQPLPGEP